jgi:hypothetical protein
MAVGSSAMSCFIEDMHDTSGLDSAILIFGVGRHRAMSELPSSIQACQNYIIGVGNSVISRSVPEIHCTSGLQSAIFISGSLATSGDAENATVDSGVAENMGISVGILVISRSIPEIHCTSGLQSAIFISGSRVTSGDAENATVDSGVVENMGYLLEFR